MKIGLKSDQIRVITGQIFSSVRIQWRPLGKNFDNLHVKHTERSLTVLCEFNPNVMIFDIF